MKCLDCIAEPSIKINYGDRESYYLCKSCYLRRKNSGEWAIKKEETDEAVPLEIQNGESALNPKGFKIKK